MNIKRCSKCGELKELTTQNFEKQGNSFRNKCRVCRNAERQEKRRQEKEKDIVQYKCMEMARSAYSRVFDKSREHKKCYRNLVRPYEFKSVAHMAEFLHATYGEDIRDLISKGESPSVDRLDTSIGYTEDNIRVISHRTNTLLGVESTKRAIEVHHLDTDTREEYNSISECSDALGVCYSSIVKWLSGKHTPSKNVRVYYK